MVRIADDVYAWDEGNASSYEAVLVTGAFAEADGIAALNRAASRFMCVDERGVEHTEAEAYAGIVDDEGNDLYTPNYVSDPTPRNGALRMYVDCKGAIEPPMRLRLIEILREELAGLGDDVRVANAPSS